MGCFIWCRIKSWHWDGRLHIGRIILETRNEAGYLVQAMKDLGESAMLQLVARGLPIGADTEIVFKFTMSLPKSMDMYKCDYKPHRVPDLKWDWERRSPDANPKGGEF